jgi:hypothetical protein
MSLINLTARTFLNPFNQTRSQRQTNRVDRLIVTGKIVISRDHVKIIAFSCIKRRMWRIVQLKKIA